jgi:cold shock CspA family protein
MENYGTVKMYRQSWGFITQDTGGDIFFRRADVDCEPKRGQRVTYKIVSGTRGPRAVKVKLIEITSENWFEFLDLADGPRQKIKNDRAELRAEKLTAALRGSGGLR